MTGGASPFSVAGKRVIVTGASSGLGRATAIALATNGAIVVGCGRDRERLDATRREMAGDGHVVALGDLTLDEVMDATVEIAGKVDGVVHCAGISVPTPLRLAKREFVEAVMRTNYIAPVMLTQRLLAKGRVNKGGSILFLASSAAYRGVAGTAIYEGHGLNESLGQSFERKRVKEEWGCTRVARHRHLVSRTRIEQKVPNTPGVISDEREVNRATPEPAFMMQRKRKPDPALARLARTSE